MDDQRARVLRHSRVRTGGHGDSPADRTMAHSLRLALTGVAPSEEAIWELTRVAGGSRAVLSHAIAIVDRAQAERASAVGRRARDILTRALALTPAR